MQHTHFRILSACVIFLLSSIFVEGKSHSRNSDPNRKKYDGIDVSHHQGKINWDLVRKDRSIKFVYVKATQGTSITDKYYLRNIKGARKAGLRVGAYHYLSSRTPIRSQFNNFRKALRQAHQDLIPMIDVEREGVKGWSKKQVQDNLSLFISLIKKHYGKRALIYSQVSYYNSHLAPRFNDHFLFLGKYGSKHPTIRGKGRHNIWQFSEKGKIRGIKGYVDLNRFMSGTTLRNILL